MLPGGTLPSLNKQEWVNILTKSVTFYWYLHNFLLLERWHEAWGS